MNKKIKGVIAAMVTPMKGKRKKIAIGAMEKLIDFLLEKGIDGLFILGTTGEGLLLSVKERKEFTEGVIDYVATRVPVVVHVSHMEIEKMRELIRHAETAGADAVAILPPLYYSLPQKAIEKYFERVLCEFASFSFFLYNIPQLAGNEIAPSTLQNLAKTCNNLIGIKSSTPDMTYFQRLMVSQDKVMVFMGYDSLDYPSLLLGGQGLVSGLASVFPEPYVNLYRSIRDKRYEEAKKQQLIINKLMEALEGGIDIALYKKALEVRGIEVGEVKDPLPSLDNAKAKHFVSVIEEFLKKEVLQYVKRGS